MKALRERKPLRLQGYDYSSEGGYFVTICTKNRERCFGEIKNGIMGLDEMGIITHEFWKDIPNHFNNVVLDEFVIMPDHIHGILFLNGDPPTVGDADLRPLRWGERTKMLLLKIIHGFKSSVTRIINKNNFQGDFLFAWQRSYHDHIIRTENELNHIRKYIYFNPAQWQKVKNTQ